MMFIAVDIGNTNVHGGIMLPGCLEWSNTFRFSTENDLTVDGWNSRIARHLVKEPAPPESPRVICCSVVPSLTHSFKEYANRRLDTEVLLVSATMNLGITVSTEQPMVTGADRIVNAAVAFAGYGGPVVVVDMGTATKIDAVTHDGRFIGGAIAPGLGLAMDALAQNAAQLDAAPLSVPNQAIGGNTTQAVQAGVVLGHIKMIEGLVNQSVEELGSSTAVVLTGGHASVIAQHTAVFTDVRPNLTLDGLRLLAELNA